MATSMKGRPIAESLFEIHSPHVLLDPKSEKFKEAEDKYNHDPWLLSKAVCHALYCGLAGVETERREGERRISKGWRYNFRIFSRLFNRRTRDPHGYGDRYLTNISHTFEGPVYEILRGGGFHKKPREEPTALKAYHDYQGRELDRNYFRYKNHLVDTFMTRAEKYDPGSEGLRKLLKRTLENAVKSGTQLRTQFPELAKVLYEHARKSRKGGKA
ncbi:MAG: hypothetical protein V1835_05625 [Candidatus Micrarchaeota archaeon]